MVTLPLTLLGTLHHHLLGERIGGDAPGTRCRIKQVVPGILERRPWRVRRIHHTAGFYSTTLLPKRLSGNKVAKRNSSAQRCSAVANTSTFDVLRTCTAVVTLPLPLLGTLHHHIVGERIGGDAPRTRCRVKQLPPRILDRQPWSVPSLPPTRRLLL